MEYSNTIIFYGILTSILMSALILISLYINPRIWMHDLPKEVQKTIPEKSGMEKKQTRVVLILFIIILLVTPAMAVINSNLQPTLIEALIIAYGVCFIFNLTDLLIIDWLIVCTLTPDFIKVKGIEDDVYKNYKKHLKDFFKGVVVIIIPSMGSGLLGYVVSKLSFI